MLNADAILYKTITDNFIEIIFFNFYYVKTWCNSFTIPFNWL